MRKILSFLMVALFSATMFAANSYWFVGSLDDWASSTAMTVSTKGNYEYYAIAKQENSVFFKIQLANGSWDGALGRFNTTPGFNGTDLTDMAHSGNAWDGDNAAIYYKGGAFYIIVYKPNTDFNESSNPVICASTTLPSEALDYTVVGSAAELFGTAWDLDNNDNNMTIKDGLYTWSKTDVTLPATTVLFKIVKNHAYANGAWPESNYELPIAKSGKYDVTITFNSSTKAITATATLKKEEIVLPVIAFVSKQYNKENATADILENAVDSLSASKTIHIDSIGDYDFKIVKDGHWLSLNGAGDTKYTFHRKYTAAANITGEDLRNMVLRADNVGDYVIKWVYAKDSLHITYPAAPDTTTLYFVNTQKEWTGDIYAHAYVNETPYAEWPGTKMTDTKKTVWEKKIFSVKVPETYNNIIFNNGGSGTGNETDSKEWAKAKPYYCDGEWYADAASIPEFEPAKYYLTGDSALVVDAGLDKAKAWKPNAIKSTEETYVIKDLKAGQQYSMKLVDGESWKGFSDLTSKALGLRVGEDNNIIFEMAKKGDVTITYTDKKFTVEGDFAMPTVAFAGNVTKWAPVAMKVADDKLSASVTLENLTVGVDSFKIVLDGQWISANGEGESLYTFHRGWSEGANIKGGDRNMLLNRDKAGSYTFTWVYAKDSLHIAFPNLESFAVTVTAPTNSTIAVKEGETAIGKTVQEGTVLTVSAAPKDPAEYEIISVSAYKTGDPTTEVTITDGKLTMPAFPITITAEEKKIEYQTIYFVNKDGWETVKAYVYIDDDHKYKVWPGEAMTKTEEKAKGKDVYSYRFPAKYAKIIFNDGGEKQTENHAWKADKPYICNGIDYATAADVVLDATVKYYITGDAAVMGSWDPSAVSSPTDVYTFSDLAAGDYKFRISLDGTWNVTKGFSDLTTVSLGLKAGNDNNICFTLANAGDVTITYTDKKFTVEGDFAMPTVAFAGNVTKWAPVAMKVADDKLSASVTLENLTVGVDSFKIVLDGQWISANGEGESLYTFHRGWSEGANIKGGDRNMLLNRDKAGSYTFTWVYAKDSLHIAFPNLESFAVTVTAPTNSTIAVKDGETAIGASVQEGTKLSVSAAPKDPAEYEIISVSAYKTGDPTTKVEIKDGELTMPAFPITITAEEKKIVYQTLYFVDKDGWKGVNAYVFIDEDHKYKVWPGEAMKKEDHKVKEKDLYSYTFPAKYTTIIFNKKDETATQTGDMLWNAATPYYCNGFWYASEEAVVLDGTAKYYITGDAAVMGSWAPDAIKVASDSYTFPNLAAGTYRMKITLDGTWAEGKVKGYSDLTVKDPGFTTNGDNDIIFKLNEPSNVTVTYNATTFTVAGNFAQKEYYIAGTFTDWKKEMVKMTKKDDKYAATIEIKATEVQEFKVVYVFGTDSVWYGLKDYAVMTSADGEWEIGGGEANIGLQPTKAGDYTFTFNPEVPSLTVEMPAQGGGTALDNIDASEKAVKVMMNGQLIILKDGKMYNVMGVLIR